MRTKLIGPVRTVALPVLASCLLSTLLPLACATAGPARTETALVGGVCLPTQPCWPTPDQWQQLRAQLVGKLEPTSSPLQACVVDSASDACSDAMAKLKNPFFIQDQVGGTESLGWMGAWNAATSAYAVVAQAPGDVVAAVNFAREHRLRLVIKGTGHDYLGRSNAPDSLLIWTHAMRRVTTTDAFVPEGCGAAQAGVPAVTVEAGTRWIEAYDEVTVKHHRYVQGGGCTSVGAAGGFIQGGGFGSWSKKYGIAAAGMLQAEVVTASGDLVVANSCQNQDLFWALRGGGGGTFGVVTKVTLMTHPLPSTFGSVSGHIKAHSDSAFAELLTHFVEFYGQNLNNESWGEQVHVKGDDTLEVAMVFQGMSADDAKRVWEPFRHWAEQHPDALTVDLHYGALPGEKMWDQAFFETHVPGAIKKDDRPGEPASTFWWSGDGEQAATYWYSYQSRWVPLERIRAAEAPHFAQALFDASRHWTVELHFNKGQAGASADARKRDLETSMNPAVLDAAALAIVAASGSGYPGVRGQEPNATRGANDKAEVATAMKILADATPGAGSYVNETDYFQPDWQRAFWGGNYEKLLAIKRKYDPTGLFVCHHCVGSEGVPDAR